MVPFSKKKKKKKKLAVNSISQNRRSWKCVLGIFCKKKLDKKLGKIGKNRIILCELDFIKRKNYLKKLRICIVNKRVVPW